MGRVCLKEYKDLCNNKITLEEYEKISIAYIEKVKKQGWRDVPIEGGYVSPDNSTIYIYSRSPYYGQLLNYYRPNSEEDYRRICAEFISRGDFIDQDDIWKEMKENTKNNIEKENDEYER